MSNPEDTVTPEGRRRIEHWQHAQLEVRRCKDRLNSAETTLTNAIIELGKWLLPSDAIPGEKIAVWFGDSMIQAEVRHNRDPLITIRTRGRALDR